MPDRALMKKEQLASRDRSDGRAVKRTRQSFVTTFSLRFSSPTNAASKLGDSASPAVFTARNARSDLIFTMSDNMRPSHATCDKHLRHNDGRGNFFHFGRACRLLSTSYGGQEPDWWSQTGSNRRPPACKAGALPTELWPR